MNNYMREQQPSWKDLLTSLENYRSNPPSEKQIGWNEFNESSRFSEPSNSSESTSISLVDGYNRLNESFSYLLSLAWINRSFKESQQKILDEYRNSLITLVNSYDHFSLETSLLKNHRMGKYVRGLCWPFDEHYIFVFVWYSMNIMSFRFCYFWLVWTLEYLGITLSCWQLYHPSLYILLPASSICKSIVISWIISSTRLQILCLVTHSHSTPQYSLKRPGLSIPKSSYLLVRLKFPTFAKAASWDNICKSYNNRTSKLVTGSKPKGKGAVFPYLMNLGLGVKYTECFEMRQSSHSMILHRKQAMNQSRFEHCVFSRASRV